MRSIRRILGNVIFIIIYPGLYFILSNSHRTRVIISVNEEVLFVNNWLADNKLSLPGGGIKTGEASVDGAVREVFEETGISLLADDLKVVVINLKVKETGIRYLVDCYSITLPKTVSTTSNHLEILQSVWVPWKQKIDTKVLSKATNQLLRAWLDTQHLVN